MTSKEMLLDLVRHINLQDCENKVLYYNQIEKDLELLEIIKTHKLLNYVLKNKKCADMYKLTDSELIKLKEWLENDGR